MQMHYLQLVMDLTACVRIIAFDRELNRDYFKITYLLLLVLRISACNSLRGTTALV